MKRWCEEAGGNITIKQFDEAVKEPVTIVDDTNPFWMAFKNATDEVLVKIIIDKHRQYAFI